jgi:hypothetical protein
MAGLKYVKLDDSSLILPSTQNTQLLLLPTMDPGKDIRSSGKTLFSSRDSYYVRLNDFRHLYSFQSLSSWQIRSSTKRRTRTLENKYYMRQR